MSPAQFACALHEANECAEPDGVRALNLSLNKFGSQLPVDFIIYKKPSIITASPTNDRLCYSNALAYAKDNGMQLAVGVVMDQSQFDGLISGVGRDGYLVKHAWVLDHDGMVFDPTLGATSNVYVGKPLNMSGMVNGGDVLRALVRMLQG